MGAHYGRIRAGRPSASPAFADGWGEASIRTSSNGIRSWAGSSSGRDGKDPAVKDLQAQDVLGPRKSLIGWL
jgi:hypothetical protein